MNKSEIQEIQNKVDDLQKQIDDLKKELNESNNVRQRIQSITYYYLDTCGNIGKTREEFTPFDDFTFDIGNYFKTEQEAKDYKENLITKQKLKDLALRLNNGVEIDWNNNYQDKTVIYFDYLNNRLSASLYWADRSLGQIYCLDKNFLDIAIQEIGEEALIKLIKSEK